MRSLLLATTFIVCGKFLYCQDGQIAASSISNQDQKYINQINEVYGTDNPPEDIRVELIRMLRKRISFQLSPATGGKDLPLLTSLPLRNTVNPAIQPFVPGQFIASTFNPLRYNFSFFESAKYQSFRIDGTDYIMIVEPYTNQR